MTNGYGDGSEQYIYTGKLKPEFISRMIGAYKTYKADKETLKNRIKDDESFYRESYSRMVGNISKTMICDTPFIFSAIENARADAIENFPSANILERSPEGSEIAEKLTKIIPAQLEISDYKKVYKDNTRNKYKYGTAIYSVTYNEFTDSIDINEIDILDIFVDMHLSDPQESQFLFISNAIENDILKEQFPKFKKLFCDDTTIETLTDDYKLKNRTTVIDCYYKKADGTLHMAKMCKNTIISATEDLDGYDGGMYLHGKYPVVFDVLFPVEHCPFGFGMIDIAKATQIEINKLDDAITENVIINAKPRYLTKRSGGIDEEEFKDWTKHVVHYEGDSEGLKPIDSTGLSESALNHRETKKDELKELLANRDFQQGATTGGVTAASAIETLQQAGEKRSRSMIDDTYDAYKDIVYMVIELMRQFYNRERSFRTTDEMGQKEFATFRNSDMYETQSTMNGIIKKPIEFDIDVVPQRENPYTRETANNTILTFWNSGLFLPQNFDLSLLALKNMNFDGKDQLIRDIQQKRDEYMMQQEQQAMAQQGMIAQQPIDQSRLDDMQIRQAGIDNGAMQAAQTAQIQGAQQIPLDIAGGV